MCSQWKEQKWSLSRVLQSVFACCLLSALFLICILLKRQSDIGTFYDRFQYRNVRHEGEIGKSAMKPYLRNKNETLMQINATHYPMRRAKNITDIKMLYSHVLNFNLIMPESNTKMFNQWSQKYEADNKKASSSILRNAKMKNEKIIHHKSLSYKPKELDPWHGVPDFILYLRLTSGLRWEHEVKDVLIRTMRIFFPKKQAKLVVVLDDEKESDHKFGEKLKLDWPFPEICYMKPGDPRIYHGWGKARMFWDMMYPDKCTNATYVGYIDSDTFFSTVVTPQLLFEEKKPVIVAKIGLAPYPCWEATTENFLGKKEVMQCMSTFPVMIKTEHMTEMREFLSKQRAKPFNQIFREAAHNGDPTCICQFSLMCNYVWYYHRDEYSWHLQMVPDGNWKGLHISSSQVPLEYYEKEVKPEMRVPIPRSSIHLRYTITNGKVLDKKEPNRQVIEDFIKEGLCYSAGFEYCPIKCKRWDSSKIHYNLYSFETYQWFWDKRCKKEQDRHYRNVKKLVKYYIKHNMEIFASSNIKEMCRLI